MVSYILIEGKQATFYKNKKAVVTMATDTKGIKITFIKFPATEFIIVCRQSACSYYNIITPCTISTLYMMILIKY